MGIVNDVCDSPNQCLPGVISHALSARGIIGKYIKAR